MPIFASSPTRNNYMRPANGRGGTDWFHIIFSVLLVIVVAAVLYVTVLKDNTPPLPPSEKNCDQMTVEADKKACMERYCEAAEHENEEKCLCTPKPAEKGTCNGDENTCTFQYSYTVEYNKGAYVIGDCKSKDISEPCGVEEYKKDNPASNILESQCKNMFPSALECRGVPSKDLISWFSNNHLLKDIKFDGQNAMRFNRYHWWRSNTDTDELHFTKCIFEQLKDADKKHDFKVSLLKYSDGKNVQDFDPMNMAIGGEHTFSLELLDYDLLTKSDHVASLSAQTVKNEKFASFINMTAKANDGSKVPGMNCTLHMQRGNRPN
eukprot:Nk52_evm4s165 gene=Nk52_evmTU4s165